MNGNIFLNMAKFSREHPLFFWFAALGILLRVIFWAYTGRIWEDALITLTPALNLWDGFGLTHHPSEPRVHSFTSPISVIIPIIGEAFNSGLLALRLSSLVGSVLSIWFAYQIGRHLKFNTWAHVLVLGYLSVDQLQIFFGMAGMETQVATAILLGGAYFLLTENWRMLGLICGLCFLTRPEFVFFVGWVILYTMLFQRNAFYIVLKFAALVALPWLAFSTLYYGSPIPNTIHAKTWGGRIGLFSAGSDQILSYLGSWWAHVAPFKEWSSVYKSPLPDFVLKGIVYTISALFAVGVASSIKKKDYKFIVLVLTVLSFFAYRTLSTINPYFMWYLPPFLALFFVIAASGISAISSSYRAPAAVFSILIVVFYGMHYPTTLSFEKMVQNDIDNAVRSEVGRRLNTLMNESDTVFLEPLGYIGIEIRGKTTYDFPGLSSPKVIATIRDLPQVRMGGVVERLKPTFIVFRAEEIAELNSYFPMVASQYKIIDHIKAQEEVRWDRGYYARYPWDTEFFILKRQSQVADL